MCYLNPYHSKVCNEGLERWCDQMPQRLLQKTYTSRIRRGFSKGHTRLGYAEATPKDIHVPDTQRLLQKTYTSRIRKGYSKGHTRLGYADTYFKRHTRIGYAEATPKDIHVSDTQRLLQRTYTSWIRRGYSKGHTRLGYVDATSKDIHVSDTQRLLQRTYTALQSPDRNNRRKQKIQLDIEVDFVDCNTNYSFKVIVSENFKSSSEQTEPIKSTMYPP